MNRINNASENTLFLLFAASNEIFGGLGWMSSNAMEQIHGTPDLWESKRLVR